MASVLLFAVLIALLVARLYFGIEASRVYANLPASTRRRLSRGAARYRGLY
jgi:hypothetical protein